MLKPLSKEKGKNGKREAKPPNMADYSIKNLRSISDFNDKCENLFIANKVKT